MIFIKIVCLFFLFFILLVLSIIFSKFKFNIEKIKIHNKDISCKIKLEIWLFYFIKIVLINIDEKGKNILKRKIPFLDIFKDSFILKIRQRKFKFDLNLTKLDLKLEKLKFYCVVGTKNTISTIYLVSIISTIISFFITKYSKKYSSKKYEFTVLPIYKDKNIINLEFEGIFSEKMIHILYVIYKNKKGGKNKYERTSYRRSYENSYE